MTLMGRWVMVGLLVGGCGGVEPHGGELLDAGPDAAPPIDAPPPPDADLGTVSSYVQDSLLLPTTPVEAQMYGLDLDGDPQGRPDNLLGSIFSTLASQGVDHQAANDQAIADGTIVHLHTMTQSGSEVRWRVYLGAATSSPPDFSGTGSFTVAADSPLDARLDGFLTGGSVVAGPGEVSIQIVLSPDGPPVRLDLVGARLEAAVSPSGCFNGRLGGALSEEDVDTSLTPAFADSMNATIAADPGCPSMCGPSALTLLDLFDANGDGMITADELRADDLWGSILAPDLDLFDAAGVYNPRVDGVKESVSLGIGFTCVPAVFTVP